MTYADAHFNSVTLAADNVVLVTSGTASGSVAVSGTGLTRTVTISNITGNGSLGIAIGSGTASDLAGNYAPAADSPSLVVDGAAAEVMGVSSTQPAGTYGRGAEIPIAVTFNDPVTVTGTPELALNAGGGAAAMYTGGSGTDTLTFLYVVGSGQAASNLMLRLDERAGAQRRDDRWDQFRAARDVDLASAVRPRPAVDGEHRH